MSCISSSRRNLGFPRIGPRRELKTALESYWSGNTDAEASARNRRRAARRQWARQKALASTIIPSNDFSLYDQVLDTIVMLGAVPPSFGWKGGPVPLELYFAMARGAQGDGTACGRHHGHGVPALEMTKWFDTNYHYIVPEFRPRTALHALLAPRPLDEYRGGEVPGLSRRGRC